ncbi:purine permease 3-like [Cornus florida]|uniref:purine permease 3-like n=1 Tax=Cornus florida TaxID=4283 RepID=UPI00289F21E5|nr:purine permease 3-like [Cornus florida]
MDQSSSKPVKTLLVLLNCILMSIGQIGGSILVRLYFLHGGKKQWLAAWLLSAGFPILIIPLAISYAQARAKARVTRLLITPRLAASSAFLGVLLGLDGYLYSFGLSYLPVSVSSLLGSTQLAFTAIFAFIVVKHKFTHYSINAVVLMTFGSVVLGLHMSGDRPTGESDGKYLLGFCMTLAAAALHGFIMPAVEYTHLKAGMTITFDLVMQVQFLVSMFSTLFCTVFMIINNDFRAIPEEAREFDLGETKYYMILVLAAIGMQLLIIGSLGLIFSSTSLLGGLVSSLLVPVQQIFAVIFLPESFNAEKGMALAMCLWGFASYFYGEYKVSREKLAAKQEPDQESV